jgi:hypothetical protein
MERDQAINAVVSELLESRSDVYQTVTSRRHHHGTITTVQIEDD